MVDIDCANDVEQDINPISNPSYRRTLIEFKELKEQLQDLLSKGFIRLSVSSWGALFLFVKNKYGAMYRCIDY